MKLFDYECITTFWADFSIADSFGVLAVKDTYFRVFLEWSADYKYLTELSMVLNHKLWQHYKSDTELAQVYQELWEETDAYAQENLKGDELKYYYSVTD